MPGRLRAVRPVRSTTMSASIARISRGRLAVALALDIDEAFERPFEPRAHRAPVVAAIGHGDDFESRPVVPFDHAGDLRRHRVRAEIGREIHDADAIVAIALAAPQRLGRRLEPVGHQDARALRVVLFRLRDRKERERRHDLAALADTVRHLGDKTLLIAPIASCLLRVQQHALAVRVIGPDVQQLPIRGDRFVIALELAQRMRAAVQALPHNPDARRAPDRSWRALRRAASDGSAHRRDSCRHRHRRDRR